MVGSADHLDEDVRPDLDMSDAHRIARIDRDRWIGCGRAQETVEGLERLLRSARRQRPDNLLIIGASNNGKTAIARRFVARTLPRVSGGENPRLNGEGGFSPFCDEGAAVLVAVKDACRAASRWPSAILDRPCARRHGRSAGRDDGMAVLIEQQDDCFD